MALSVFLIFNLRHEFVFLFVKDGKEIAWRNGLSSKKEQKGWISIDMSAASPPFSNYVCRWHANLWPPLFFFLFHLYTGVSPTLWQDACLLWIPLLCQHWKATWLREDLPQENGEGNRRPSGLYNAQVQLDTIYIW